MHTIENLVTRIDNSSFFNQLNAGIGDNFFIPNIETAFIEPNLELLFDDNNEEIRINFKVHSLILNMIKNLINYKQNNL